MVASLTASKRRTDALSKALVKMSSTTSEATKCCELLTKRARQLDSLTSPASDASSMLSRANANLAATLVLMKDSREKFDTVADCEPAMERLQAGIAEMEAATRSRKAAAVVAAMQPGKNNNNNNNNNNNDANNASGSGMMLKHKVVLTEQDVYAACDAMEILRDAHGYFLERRSWRSAPSTLSGLERLYGTGSDSMCWLVRAHLKKAGPANRPKRNKPVAVPASTANGGGGGSGSGASVAPSGGGGGGPALTSSVLETAQQTRDRLAAALQNRDLLKSVGEYEEYQPVEARPIREIRAIVDCLGSQGYQLGPLSKREPPGLSRIFGVTAQKVQRSEKVGSGGYTVLVKEDLKTGFPQMDAFGQARKEIAFFSMDSYYRKVKSERKKRMEKWTKQAAEATKQAAAAAAASPSSTPAAVLAEAPDLVTQEADAAARDAVRCLEHAMVTAAGEKSVYRVIVSPSLNRNREGGDNGMDEDDTEEVSPFYRKACVAAYAYVVGSVVDRTLDIIETVFLKEGGIGHTSGSSGDKDKGPALTVRQAAAAAAAGLRMLDGVRMLGPSLAKLCDMQVGDGQRQEPSIAATLCIAIHRTTVKNTARTLENLAKAIQDDPLTGVLHRPKDASVSTVSSDVVHAVRLVSPFVSAYKSVSKRRALPWDPNMGEEAGELDSFVRFLVMRLLNSLKGKALNYTKDGREDSPAKSNLFMINNAFFLLEELGPNAIIDENNPQDAEHYRIEGSWFVDKINKLMESEKQKYLGHWEALNTHLTAVQSGDLEYQKNDSYVLAHDSGRLIKQRFSGFNEDFERTYDLHKNLCVIDPRLRITIQQDVTSVFMPRYRRFYDKYSKIKFSKKHQEDYTKYSADKIEEMLGNMYVDPEASVPTW